MNQLLSRCIPQAAYLQTRLSQALQPQADYRFGMLATSTLPKGA
jgi:hypothetical protein